MKRTIFAVGVLLSSNAAAEVDFDRPSFDSYIRCTQSQMPKLDDGVSPAETIAFATATACLREGRAMFAATEHGRDMLSRYDAGSIRRMLAKMTLNGVLRYRVQKNR